MTQNFSHPKALFESKLWRKKMKEKRIKIPAVKYKFGSKLKCIREQDDHGTLPTSDGTLIWSEGISIV